MGKKRIYELAKELNVSSKQVLNTAKKQGISVGNHMSTVNLNEEKAIRNALANKKSKGSVNAKPKAMETAKSNASAMRLLPLIKSPLK